MQFRNAFTSFSQAGFSNPLPAELLYKLLSMGCAAAGAACSGGAAELPPVNQLPTTWPMEEPTATPAAVDAICPIKPGPWLCVAAGAEAAAGGAWAAGAAAVEDGRAWERGAAAGGTVGRLGALRAGVGAARVR